jgi:hypothetical protein
MSASFKPRDFRRGPHCDWWITGVEQCRRRKELATVTNKYGATATKSYGRPLLYCPVHIEQGTRQINLHAKPTPIEREPTRLDRVIRAAVDIADLPIAITHEMGPYGGRPIRNVSLQRWYVWLFFYFPAAFFIFLGLKQHFFP